MTRGPVSGGEADRRRQAIVDVALGFVSAGFGETWTMHAIAAGAGYGIGSIYRYFPSKDDLIAAAEDEQLVRLGQELERRTTDLRRTIGAIAPSDEPALRKHAIFSSVVVGLAWIRTVEDHQVEVEVMRRIATDGRSSPAAMGPFQVVASVLEEADRCGELVVEDPLDGALVILVALTDVVLLLCRSGMEVRSRQRIATDVLFGVLEAWGGNANTLRAIDRSIGIG